LHYIAEHGLHQTLAVMLNDNIILLDSVDKDGKTTALHLAIEYGHCKLVELLLDRGTALNSTEKTGECTPLHLATQNKDIDIDNLLLQHPNIQPGLAYKYGETPLMHACCWEYPEIAKLLISHERSLPKNFIYRNGWSELHMANVDLVRLLLQHPNIQPGLADGYGWTPLMHACYSEHLEITKLLISHEESIPPNFVYKDGCPELCLVVLHQNVDLVCLLLQHPNIQPGLAGEDGWTPLMHACCLNNLEIAKLLISHEKSIPPNFVYKNRWSELCLAIDNQNVELLHLLLQHPNIQPGLEDVDRWTPLMYPHSHRNFEIAELLL
ncbi:ankyrin repeat-containing domain protein, partial [Mycena floridula]